MTDISVNTGPVALIFEGGGMRDAYTAAVAATLLRADIVFPKAYGISAGAELAVDYVSRSLSRVESLFITLSQDSQAGGARSFLTGHGFFNTTYAFVEVAEKAAQALKGGASGSQSKGAIDYAPLAFDFDAFKNAPGDVHIEAFDARDGSTKVWTKTAMPSTKRVMECVAASSSYPLFTPPLYVDGVRYIDGGMGSSAGICLDAAIADGFKRFFIVRSQPKPYRMHEVNPAKRAFYKSAYRSFPKAYEAIVNRPASYNHLLDRIDDLVASKEAYLFCPETMPLTYMTVKPAALIRAYQLALDQCAHEINDWVDWLCGA